MRPLHLKFAAGMLLAACAILIARQANQSNHGYRALTNDQQKKSTRGCEQTANAIFNKPQSLSTSMHITETSQNSTPSEAANPHPAADAVESTTPNTDSLPDKPIRGIQLGWNVQLPAVLMEQPSTPDKAPTLAITAATREIANTFYQKIAASRAAKKAAANQPADSDTVVIEPGPEVEQARNEANETYRALFGDEAYNRATMGSAIEVHLPVNSDKP